MMRTLLIGALLMAPTTTTAITLPTTWASSMVIQRGVPVTLWGLDEPGAVVTLTCTAPWCTSGLKSEPADSTGRFEVKLPAAPASTTPFTITLASTKSGSLKLSDLLVGDVYFCSGQSNMELSVENTAEQEAVLAKANTLGATLRIFSVAMLAEYADTKSPQVNLTASIPWSRASASSAPGMSAFCYGFGAEAVQAHPEVPIGLQNNAWGGVAIQVYMSPAAMQECAHVAAPQPSMAERLASDDRSFYALAADAQARGLSAQPGTPSCLYNSMTYPLLSSPITGILWYQGESNAGDPVGYQCMQRAMIADWRKSWAKVGASPTLPFIFAQISAWPTGGHAGDMIPTFRVAVEKTLTDLPRVGMVVSADIADPAGSYHPIHPPWKAELSRRAWLWADNEIYGNKSSPLSGPRVVSVTWDQWDNWGNYHHGTGANSYVCQSACPGATCWTCAGLRVRFDQPIKLRKFYTMNAPHATDHIYDFTTGSSSGFEVWSGSWFQPTALTGLVDDFTVQLNLTYIEPQSNSSQLVNKRPTPRVLKYAWAEYPSAMPIVNAFGLPAGPFNVSITAAA